MNQRTRLWLDQIPDTSNRLAVIAAAFSIMVAIIVLYEQLGWLT